jgi:hypothetical protein
VHRQLVRWLERAGTRPRAGEPVAGPMAEPVEEGVG